MMPGSTLLVRPDRVAREQNTLAYLAGLLHVMPPDTDALRLLARLFDAVPADDPVELEAFYGQLTRAVAELLAARRVGFLARDDGALRWQPQAYGIPGQILSTARLACRVDGDAPLELVVFRDFIAAGPVRPDQANMAYHDVLKSLDASTMIAVPWRAGDERLGALVALDPPRLDTIRDRDVWVLRLAAGLAAIVWQRSREPAGDQDEEARRLRADVGRLASLEKAKSDFLSLASHELRAPLSVLGGYLSLLADGSLGKMPPQMAHTVPIMLAKAQMMNVLIARMLETSRLDDSRLQLRLERLDLVDVVQRAVRSVESTAIPGQQILVEAATGPLYVHGDRLRLETIVQNLLDNALKYSPSGTDVQCVVTRTDAVGRVAVKDRGIGIAAADMPRLFSRFGRIIPEEHRQIGGTGLGLYLSRELARMHGGDVTVASVAGQGSEFVLTLPLAS